ncbi:hypothetical protein [Microbacterium suaedae]|uniref:hypothetical protein n=1 Tax=Microbacterium suaedae TaxID=2067813 RepID=UPI000DA1C8FF|nr:hypothetical protein [Microbacterium suaedae]
MTARCKPGGVEASDKTGYSQDVSKPTLTVVQGGASEKHDLSWIKVSSLSTTFQVTFTAAHDTGVTSVSSTKALKQTVTHPRGSTYGNAVTYRVEATAGDGSASSGTKKTTTKWPHPPKARNITYTADKQTSVAGTITWNITTTAGRCTDGTFRQSRVIENRAGQSNGSMKTGVTHRGSWGKGSTSYRWNPSGAKHGYAYGVSVETRCVSTTTGLVSSVDAVQSVDFVTPLPKPKAPVWTTYNLKDKIVGKNRTWSTCFYGTELPDFGNESTFCQCPTMKVDYRTFCTSGAKVSWSSFESQMHDPGTPQTYSHSFGWRDYWMLGGYERARHLRQRSLPVRNTVV